MNDLIKHLGHELQSIISILFSSVQYRKCYRQVLLKYIDKEATIDHAIERAHKAAKHEDDYATEIAKQATERTLALAITMTEAHDAVMKGLQKSGPEKA